ncbi:type II toxin-antitoxin system HicA family toxin [Microbacterium sp. 2216-1]|uniref:type II toxin-antitoxin system HicA family toxin n=1 Tax=Microbacterium sp. 2216-1 TaxID=3390053 RepID=UPI00397645DB
MIKLLKRRNWRPLRTAGSHTTWQGPNGTTFTLPDGHTTISPGVYRNLLKALHQDEQ